MGKIPTLIVKQHKNENDRITRIYIYFKLNVAYIYIYKGNDLISPLYNLRKRQDWKLREIKVN